MLTFKQRNIKQDFQKNEKHTHTHNRSWGSNNPYITTEVISESKENLKIIEKRYTIRNINIYLSHVSKLRGTNAKNYISMFHKINLR